MNIKMLYGMMQDAWRLVKKFEDAWMVDAAWEQMSADAEDVIGKYQNAPVYAQTFIRRIVLAVLDYFMERGEE